MPYFLLVDWKHTLYLFKISCMYECACLYVHYLVWNIFGFIYIYLYILIFILGIVLNFSLAILDETISLWIQYTTSKRYGSGCPLQISDGALHAGTTLTEWKWNLCFALAAPCYSTQGSGNIQYLYWILLVWFHFSNKKWVSCMCILPSIGDQSCHSWP